VIRVPLIIVRFVRSFVRSFTRFVAADYTAYDRDRLEELGLGEYVDALLSAQSKTWEELSDDERSAASKFCFFEEVWNRDTLGTW
jgi:hypothetical protein